MRQGTRREAILFSVGANAQHGLRRSNSDKRRAVETLLNDEEWKEWGNREIGRRCGVDDKTVAAIKAERASICGISADRPSARKVQRGGTIYEQKVKQAKPPEPVEDDDPFAELNSEAEPEPQVLAP